MITTAEFKKQIGKAFGKEMRLLGFKGSGFEYFQQNEDFLFAVYISSGRWGSNCSAGFAIHPKIIDVDSNGKRDIDKLKIYQYEFKFSLTEHPRGERWDYADDEATNLASVNAILDSIKSKAFPVIDQFKANPSVLDFFEVNELEDFHNNWRNKTKVSIATTVVRFAWAMTLVFENKNIAKAKQFAEWGISKRDDSIQNWFGDKDFDRIMKK